MSADRVEFARLDNDQIEPAAEILARAVFDDPISIHAFPDEAERARSLPRFIAAHVRYAQLFGTVDMVPGRPDAVAAWLPPTGAEETPERLALAGVDRVGEVIGQTPADRFQTMFAGMDERMREVVPEAHWYLFIIGVDPPRRRQGLGSALLRMGLERAASEGTPVSLLTAEPRNIPFYERHGMRIAYEGSEPSSGVRYWVFLKDPVRDP
jgi:ribosomal protein S18 acetylase RimI-like enzyme